MSAKKKKPEVGLRRTTRTQRRPMGERERNIALERVARRSERPNAPSAEPAGRGIVKRAGRKFADGRESPAGELRRLAVYIPVELFDELEARARASRKTLSKVAAEVFAEAFGVRLEAVG